MAGSLNSAPPAAGRTDESTRSPRWVNILLLAGSLVTLALLAGAIARENFLTPWRYHQRHYRNMLRTSSDERQRKLGDSFQIEPRQVDLPQLGTTDRCVSCHVGIENPAMAHAAQPYRSHVGDLLQHHPLSKYGCTVCHRGQGAATNFREAKASDVHWDYPLLPSRLTQASCGTCHAADSPLMEKHAPLLFAGRQLFVDRGCQGCHKLDGVGGQLGPALDDEGRKIRHQMPMAQVQGERTLVNWLQQHFDSPQAIVPGSLMRPPRLTPAENDALTAYMLSLSKLDLPQTYVAPDRVIARAAGLSRQDTDPARLFQRFCAGCHGDGTHGTWDKFFQRFGPAVRGPGLRAVADRDYLRAAIEKGRPGTQMPAWGKNAGGLSAAQVEALVNYLAGDQPPGPKAALPELRGGNVGRGAELFTQLCAGCHGANRLAPSLGNSVFQQSASDEFLARTILGGRPDTAMPAFRRGDAGITDDELRHLIAYLRSLRKTPNP